MSHAFLSFVPNQAFAPTSSDRMARKKVEDGEKNVVILPFPVRRSFLFGLARNRHIFKRPAYDAVRKARRRQQLRASVDRERASCGLQSTHIHREKNDAVAGYGRDDLNDEERSLAADGERGLQKKQQEEIAGD